MRIPYKANIDKTLEVASGFNKPLVFLLLI